jgi:hypothetical protein
MERMIMMFRLGDSSWLRAVPLLLALTAGIVTTRLVPPYRDIAWALQEEKGRASASSGSNFSGMTGIDVDLRHLQFAQRIG